LKESWKIYIKTNCSLYLYSITYLRIKKYGRFTKFQRNILHSIWTKS
jgi:hypothetical protein